MKDLQVKKVEEYVFEKIKKDDVEIKRLKSKPNHIKINDFFVNWMSDLINTEDLKNQLKLNMPIDELTNLLHSKKQDFDAVDCDPEGLNEEQDKSIEYILTSLNNEIY